MSSGRISNGSRCRTRIERAKEGILKYGLLFWFIRGIGKMLKSIWNLLIFRKKEKEKLKSPMGEIYQLWEEDWLSDEADKRKAKEDPFFLLFKFDYEYCCQKALENKKKNFRIKFLGILPFLVVTFLCLGGVIAYNANVFIQVKGNMGEFIEKNNWNFSIYGTVFYVAAILVMYVISKWLDVKQYQETWSRHMEHKYAVEMEMFKFIRHMEDYTSLDRKQKFIRNIMKTWDDNQKKFIDNMKNEKGTGVADLLLNHVKAEKSD